MNNDQVPRKVEEFQIEEIDGELLLYNAGSTETIYLNEPAAIVWYLCDGERSVGEITGLLTESYPDASEGIESDVRDILQSFEDHGCVVFEIG